MSKQFSLVNGSSSDHWHEVLAEALQRYGTLEPMKEDEAVNRAIEKNYDAIILDNGSITEIKLLIRRLLAQRPESRIVVVDSAPSFELARGVLREGAIDCIRRLDQKEELQTAFTDILKKTVPHPSWLTLSEAPNAPRALILLADNQISYLKTWQETLEREGYIVLPAANLIEAERILKREEVDLAIIDMRLEDDNNDMDESGLKLATSVAPSVYKIILTRYPTHESVREAMAVREDGVRATIDFVDKRENRDAILISVKKAVEIAEERRVEQSLYFLRQRGRMFATIALLLAIGAAVLAIVTGDPKWLLATIALVIFVVFFIVLFVK